MVSISYSPIATNYSKTNKTQFTTRTMFLVPPEHIGEEKGNLRSSPESHNTAAGAEEVDKAKPAGPTIS
jgi:hypothetical protein